MLNIKSQKIIPNIPAESTKVSFVLSSQDLAEHVKDWDFFAVFAFEGSQPINAQVAVSIVTDIFSHSLVLDGAEPILQILEKSIKECKEALQKMQAEAVFSAAVGIFKDSFVYVSIYGDSKALYLDGTQVVHVDMEKEGNFACATQKIEDGKVMVLCTQGFFKKFPPKSLISLTKPILAQDLDELSSAVILKVDNVEAEKLVKEKTFDSSKPVVAVRSVEPKEPKKFLKPLLIGVAGLLIVAGGFFVLKNTLLKPKNPPQNVDQQSNVPKEEPNNSEIQGELAKKLDEANKVKRVSAQVFYDISITDAKASPGELALGQNYIAVCDSAQGKIYVSTRTVTKFDELPQLFPGVKNLLFEGDTLIFTDNEGVKFYALATKSVTKSYLADPSYPTIGPSSEYLGFTYALSGDKLVKFSKVGNKLTGVLWAQKPEFTNGISMDIDGSIYVLFSNGGLEKYTAGAKDDFSIVGLDKPIQKPLKVVTNADYKQIYVGDGAEGRLVAFDTDGVLAFQIKPQLGSEWMDLKSFDISTDEKTFYVLSGTKVYEFSL